MFEGLRSMDSEHVIEMASIKVFWVYRRPVSKTSRHKKSEGFCKTPVTGFFSYISTQLLNHHSVKTVSSIITIPNKK